MNFKQKDCLALFLERLDSSDDALKKMKKQNVKSTAQHSEPSEHSYTQEPKQTTGRK